MKILLKRMRPGKRWHSSIRSKPSTNVTIERFTKNLNGENAAEFSRIIQIILRGMVVWKLIRTVCLLYLSWRRNSSFKYCIFCSLVLSKTNHTTQVGGVPESVATSNAGLAIAR